jgi:hypothetical protein
MKKSLVVSLLLCMLYYNPANAQLGNMLKSVKKSVTKELTGTTTKSSSSNSNSKSNSSSAGTNSNSSSSSNSNISSTSASTGSSTNTSSGNNNSNMEPEPSCSCDQAVLVMEMGKYQIDYTELSISVQDDGSVLVKDSQKGNYYIVKNGITEGPYKTGDPVISGFQVDKKNDNDIEVKDIPLIYKSFISMSGEKYLITFNGKKYGPYSQISKFVVSKTKDKFAAIVTENIILTDELRKRYEVLLNKAKTDDERMQISMKMSKEMEDRTKKYGPQSEGPIFISNVPGAVFDKSLVYSANFYNNIKYGEIVTESSTIISDLQGKKILTYDYSECSPESMFISSDNSRYACYSEGTLTLGDNTKFSELFNPYLLKMDGKPYLAYMYYSPKRNAIMQCKMPF